MSQGEVQITIVGNLVADPELRFTNSGTAVSSFRVASTPKRFDGRSNQWVDGDPVFMSCTAWRGLAENIQNTLAKGMRVVVVGVLQQQSYEDRSGVRRTSLNLVAHDVAPSLRFATAEVFRGGGGFRAADPEGGGSAYQSSRDNSQSGNGWSSSQSPWGDGGTDQPPF